MLKAGRWWSGGGCVGLRCLAGSEAGEAHELEPRVHHFTPDASLHLWLVTLTFVILSVFFGQFRAAGPTSCQQRNGGGSHAVRRQVGVDMPARLSGGGGILRLMACVEYVPAYVPTPKLKDSSE
jgi:hypothetical protein